MAVQLDEAHVLRPGDGEVLTGDERELRVKISRPELDVLEFDVGPDYEGPGPHFHKEHVDTFYVLEGELEFTLGEETKRAGPGMFIAAPPGAVHGFTNAAPGHSRFLNIHAPDRGFTELMRFRDRGEERNPEDYDIWNLDGEPPPPDADDAIILGPGRGESIPGDHRDFVVKLERPELEVIEFTCDPDFGPVEPHVHPDKTDSFYILEGEIEFTIGEEPVRAGSPGTYVAAPAGVRHGFRNPGPGTAHFLNVHAPADGFIERVRRAERRDKD